MKGIFIKLPQPVQKYLLLRFGIAALSVLLCICLMLGTNSFVLSVPSITLFLICIVESINILYVFQKEKYICLQGVCTKTETTCFHDKIKAVYIETKQGTVKLRVKNQKRKIVSGDYISAYISMNIPVYEREGVYIINSYYVMDIQKN